MPVSAEFPEKLAPLFEPHRYKVLYGGRGGAKSWGVARALLILGAQKPLRILCARELQKSIEESVHRLLSDQIIALGMQEIYHIEKAHIYGPNGTIFSFEGIRYNSSQIKSHEGDDICWVEEANNVTRSSWNFLIPTIRRKDSEIWITFNPELETDDTYQRFVKKTPPNTALIKLSWRDNPWFPSVLKEEMETLKTQDYDEYLNVWEGNCRVNLAGAVYARELRALTMSDPPRLTKVPYEPGYGVDTFWDLGHADSTAIWFGQRVGFEYHIIDYLEDKQQHIDHYLRELQMKPYVYNTHWLPHDAKAKQLGTKRTIEEQIKATGRKVRIVPKLSVADGINAARTIFPNCWFDEEATADGIQCLRHYRYEVKDHEGSLSQNPVHDWSSHGADAFRYLAIALKSPKPKKEESEGEGLIRRISTAVWPGTSNNRWMG